MKVLLFCVQLLCIAHQSNAIQFHPKLMMLSLPSSNSKKVNSISNSIQFIDGTSSGDDEGNEILENDDSQSQRSVTDLAGLAPNDLEDRIAEVCKLGWNKDDSKRALVASNYDVGEAASLLELQQDEMESLSDKVNELVQLGWTKLASEHFIAVTEGNVTEALHMMELTENNTFSSFEKNVQTMIDNGWDERVARVAQYGQFKVDRNGGRNASQPMTDDERSRLRPSLRQQNLTSDEDSAATSSASAKAKSLPGPTPAQKNDVVFEVTASDLQSVVLDSKVPVLLDVYADWCAPCKQLGPMLENAAIQSGGMFRLAKVNADSERDLVEMLEATGLPTVYAVNDGKLTDRFVGIPSQENLQQFLVRAVTGVGERFDSTVTDQQLEDITAVIAQTVGLASIGSQKKARLQQMVRDALDLSISSGDSKEAQDGVLSPGIQTALRYLDNCKTDIRDKLFRSVNASSMTFQKVAGDDAALKLMEVAGFRPVTKPGAAALGVVADIQSYDLVHTNVAIISLVTQEVSDWVSARRQSATRGTVDKVTSKFSSSEGKQNYEKDSAKVVHTPTVELTKSSKSGKTTKTAVKSTELTMTSLSVLLRSEQSVFAPRKKVFNDRSTTLRSALSQLLSGKDGLSVEDLAAVQVRYPNPRRRIDVHSADMGAKLSELVGKDGSLSLVAELASERIDEQQQKSKQSKGGLFGRLRRRVAAKKQAKAEKSQREPQRRERRFNEYSNGDNTVLSGGDEEDDE